MMFRRKPTVARVWHLPLSNRTFPMEGNVSPGDVLRHLLPALGILALIALWVLAMLCGMSFFSSRMPDAPSPTRWQPRLMRSGLVLFMGLVGAMVAQRNGVWPGYHLWVAAVGGALGLAVDLVWRRLAARFG